MKISVKGIRLQMY